MCVDLLEVRDLYESRMGYYGNMEYLVEYSVGGRRVRAEDRKPNYVACSA